jgi:hypothetical protein
VDIVFRLLLNMTPLSIVQWLNVLNAHPVILTKMMEHVVVSVPKLLLMNGLILLLPRLILHILIYVLKVTIPDLVVLPK